MATEDHFIVAIEIGTKKVTGIAGRKQPDGVLLVLACESEPSSSFVLRGRINNVLKMTACITQIKERLEKKLKKAISQAYVGIGGMGTFSVKNDVFKSFTEPTIVSADVIEEIEQDNSRSMPDGRVILKTIIQEYRLGAKIENDPVGVPSESIEGRFLNVVTRKDAKDRIVECMHNAHLEVVDMPISTLTLAAQMVPASERHSGCVFVDMGAQTTSVAVFKNNILRHMAVIPLGGDNITRDIMSLSLEESEAERLKIAYGCALAENSGEAHNPIMAESGRAIKYDEFSNLVEARQEEIIRNVRNQIELSGYKRSELVGGIILTGGASKIKNIEKAFQRTTDMQNVQVAKNITTTIRTASVLGQSFNKDGAYNMAIALLEQGEVNCCGGDIPSDIDIFEQQRRAEEAEAARKAEEEAEAAAAAEAEAAEQKAREEEEERQRLKDEKNKKRKEKYKRIKDWLISMVSDPKDENDYE